MAVTKKIDPAMHRFPFEHIKHLNLDVPLLESLIRILVRLVGRFHPRDDHQIRFLHQQAQRHRTASKMRLHNTQRQE